MKERRKRERRKTLTYSFVSTLSVLGIVTAFLYFTVPPIPSVKIPDALPQYNPIWGKYVPSDILQMTFENFTLMNSLNSSLPAESSLLELGAPRISLNTTDIKYILTMAFQVPNATLDVAFVKSSVFALFTQALSSRGAPQQSLGRNDFYFVSGRAGNQTVVGWLALLSRDGAIAFARGTSSAKQVIMESLAVSNNTVNSIMTRRDFNQMLWTVNGVTHVALSFQNFPGVVRTGDLTMISVDVVQGAVRISYLTKFADSADAASQVGAVKSAYLSSHEFVRYDSYIKAVTLDSLSHLDLAVRLAH